ncbi:unnamed protein product [Chrysoparadoxa australica]
MWAIRCRPLCRGKSVPAPAHWIPAQRSGQGWAARRSICVVARKEGPMLHHKSPSILQARPMSENSAAELDADEAVALHWIDEDGEKTTVLAPLGKSLLEVAHENDIELEGACGGDLACSTCHVILPQEYYDNLPEKQEEEEDMLDLAWGLTDTSRLGCQIEITKDLEGMTIQLPEES